MSESSAKDTAAPAAIAEKTAATAVPQVAAQPPSAADPAAEATTSTPDHKVADVATAAAGPTPATRAGVDQAAPVGTSPASEVPRQSDENPKQTALAAVEPRTNAADLDARIAALERQIAGDEESLKALLSEVPAPGAPELATRPEFREIALRLPKLQAELRTLQDQRARHTEP
ncbi:MAG TPA: hypothetical protein VKM54_04810 [Myxococcota bacterium]|nr:hypothetical protein [Myxococcota bacterium]